MTDDRRGVPIRVLAQNPSVVREWLSQALLDEGDRRYLWSVVDALDDDPSASWVLTGDGVRAPFAWEEGMTRSEEGQAVDSRWQMFATGETKPCPICGEASEVGAIFSAEVWLCPMHGFVFASEPQEAQKA